MTIIYLIGFMGSGKSTIGRKLAKNLGVSFVDTDDYIEQKYNQRIANIFDQFGENTFREYEVEALKEVSNRSIVATGGGIVERKVNKDTMKSGVVVYLETSFSEILNRLKEDQSRPLWGDSKEKRKMLFQRRVQLYREFADQTIDTTNKRIHDIVQEIANSQ